MLDGGTNCGKGEQLWQPYMVREDHWWRRVWSGRTTYGADNLRRDMSHIGVATYVKVGGLKSSKKAMFIMI